MGPNQTVVAEDFDGIADVEENRMNDDIQRSELWPPPFKNLAMFYRIWFCSLCHRIGGKDMTRGSLKILNYIHHKL